MPAPKGNNYAMKWPTPEDRKDACKKFCAHLKDGYTIESFPYADRKTIRYYAEQFPEDFPPDQLEEAERWGKHEWERIGIEGTKGQIANFNASSWKFNMENRRGWRSRTDVDARGIFGGPDDVDKVEKLKARSAEEIALGVVALLSGQTGNSNDGSGNAD